MAKILTEDVLKALKKFDLPKGYQRTGEFPLDPSSVFSSKADADLYAAGGADSRGLSGTRYAGQLIAVVEAGVTTLYTVEANDTLKAVGGDVSADLADLTGKVNAILDGATIDSFKDVEDALAALPKDMVVSGGEVRKPTTEEKTTDDTLDVDAEYIILTIKNAEEGKDKLFIPAKALVDVYTSGDEYINIADHKVTANISVIETKLVADGFAKTADITAATKDLASKDELNGVSATATAASNKADANEGKIGTLENTVGNAESGLVKDVNDLKDSVAKKVDSDTYTAKITVIEGDITNIKSDIASINEKVAANENAIKEAQAAIKAIDYPVKGVDSTASNGVSLGLSEEKNVTVSVDAAAITAAVKPNLDLKSTDVKTSAAIGGSADAPTYAADSTIQNVLTDLDKRVAANASSIKAAVAGGVVSVGAGDGIKVDASKTTSPKVSVKTAETSGLFVDASGLTINLAPDGNLRFNANNQLDLVWLGDAE